MKNLAGVAECDAEIRRELTRSRIEVVEGPRVQHEVAATLTGKLGPFTFTRAWYYWVVKGPVPIDIARKLYADPVGRTDVRVAGHCACPSPDEGPWTTHYDANGKQLAPARAGEEERIGKHLIEKGLLPPDAMDKYTFVEDPRAVAVTSFVETYHIDSEIGLRLFADSVRHLQGSSA